MKSTPTLNSTESALDKRNDAAPGTLPVRQDTVRAEVLAFLLEGRRLTGLESVFQQNTTRLAAHVHALKTEYAWLIDHQDKVKLTKDGRRVKVTEYSMPPAKIAQAMQMGAHTWVEEVHVARAIRKRKTREKKQAVAKGKAASAPACDPRQRSVWEGA